MKNIKRLNVYLSNLAVLNASLHNIHWNITGKQFMRIHDFTEELYDDLFEKYDEVAEHLKMKEEKPLVTLSDYLSNATVKELEQDTFTSKESLELVLEYLEEMKNIATEIRNAADGEEDFETVAMFEDHVADYSKNIWFAKAMLA